MRRSLTLAALCWALPAFGSDWAVDHAASRLGFHTTQQDGQLAGEFRSWDAAVRFDPEHPQDAVIDVTIDIASITTGSRQRDRYLPDEEWFHTARFPTAAFHATRVEPLGGERYLAHGELTLRGVTAPVELPFTWTSRDGTAEVRAETALERTRFGVGAGEFADADVVGLTVQVVAELTLHEKTEEGS